MYQVRYLMYLACSIIGGMFLVKIVPGSDIMTNAAWFMVSNVLYEILEWKFNVVEETDESQQ